MAEEKKIRTLVCICCPRGCRLEVDAANGWAVTGNACPRGAEYGKKECTAPERTVTTTVAVAGGLYPRCPVKTAAPVPKEKVQAVVDTLDGLVLPAPIRLGQVIVPNAAGTGVDLVATRDLPRGE